MDITLSPNLDWLARIKTPAKFQHMLHINECVMISELIGPFKDLREFLSSSRSPPGARHHRVCLGVLTALRRSGRLKLDSGSYTSIANVKSLHGKQRIGNWRNVESKFISWIG